MDHTPHYRQRLNNYLQGLYRDDPREHLVWDTSHKGPDNKPIWTAIAYLHEIEWGRGDGSSRGSAMEAAAKCVLIALKVPLEETKVSNDTTA